MCSVLEGQQVNTSTRNWLYMAIISLHLPFRINNPADIYTLKLLSYSVYGAKECGRGTRLHLRRGQDLRLLTVKLPKASQLVLFKETTHICSDNYMNTLISIRTELNKEAKKYLHSPIRRLYPVWLTLALMWVVSFRLRFLYSLANFYRYPMVCRGDAFYHVGSCTATQTSEWRHDDKEEEEEEDRQHIYSCLI